MVRSAVHVPSPPPRVCCTTAPVTDMSSSCRLGINERITEKRRMEIYKAKHGGLPPPTMRTKLEHSDKLQFRAFRCCCPCLVPKTAH